MLLSGVAVRISWPETPPSDQGVGRILSSAAGSYLARFTERRPRSSLVVLAAGCCACLALAGTGTLPLVALTATQFLLGTTQATMAWSHGVFDDDLRNTQGSLVAVAGGPTWRWSTGPSA